MAALETRIFVNLEFHISARPMSMLVLCEAQPCAELGDCVRDVLLIFKILVISTLVFGAVLFSGISIFGSFSSDSH